MTDIFLKDIFLREVVSRNVLSKDVFTRDILSRAALSRDILSRDKDICTFRGHGVMSSRDKIAESVISKAELNKTKTS